MTTEYGAGGGRINEILESDVGKRRGKPPTVKSLIAACDTLFSKIIRFRDLPELHGFCACCRKLIQYNGCHCGHYVSRQFWKYRWDERNAAACCVHCNTFLEGNKGPLSRWIDKKWGAGTAEMLDGTKNGGRKPRIYELAEIKRQLEEKLESGFITFKSKGTP